MKSHDEFCFVCGSDNPIGFKLQFSTDNNGITSTEFNPSCHHQSYDNTLHGGIQSLFMDACMVQSVKAVGIEAITGKMEIKYNEQVVLDASIILSAKITKKHGPYFFVESSIEQNGIIKTTSSGIYKKKPLVSRST